MPAVTLDSIRQAAGALKGYAWRTPLIESPTLSRLAGAEVRLKCEFLQPVGAFKARGAITALLRIPEAERKRGVVTQSSGNHGQAVAYAASKLGMKAVVVMPKTAPAIKVDGVKKFGAEVVLVETAADREPKATELAASRGLIYVPPFEHLDVIAGQGTVGLEIMEQWPAVGAILVPVGGGGLLAGVATAVSGSGSKVRVIGVEPALVPKLSTAIKAGAPSAVERQTSLADGLLPPAVGKIPYAQIEHVVRESAAVTEEDLAAGVKFLYDVHGLRIEPSGAATVAALVGGRIKPGVPTVAILSGGNVDPDLFDRLVR